MLYTVKVYKQHKSEEYTYMYHILGHNIMTFLFVYAKEHHNQS